MQEDWTLNQWLYIEWLALPRFTRIPPTQEMLATQLNVDPSTLTRWSKIPGFQEEVNGIARASLGKALPGIYAALIREAENGNYQHIQLAMEMASEYTKKSEVKSDVKGDITFRFVEVETEHDDE